jgi:transcriptional regulator with GAF, ATPase, and Fis domain
MICTNYGPDTGVDHRDNLRAGILKILEEVGWNLDEAAARMGTTVRNLKRLMQRYNIKRDPPN